MPRSLSNIGEFGLIDRIRRSAPSYPGVVKGIGDDAAVLAPKGELLLWTTDMLIEGTHFIRKQGARLIGRKALACSISDIAAMGGLPTYAVVSLGVPPKTSLRFVRDLYAGINGIARQFKIAIVGGDTCRSTRIVVNVALLGTVKKFQLVTRGGARPGDVLFVTGKLGGSLKSGRHLNFVPRIKESQFLVRHFKPTAMIDLSDGLASDLNHILNESEVGAEVDPESIPRYPGVTLKQALSDGEDYELLFTVRPAAAQRLMKTKTFRFTRIGTIVKGSRRPFKTKGFTHF